MTGRIEISCGMVRIGDYIATVAADAGNARLAITGPHGELVMPTYVARAYAEQIFRACREADLQAVEQHRISDPRHVRDGPDRRNEGRSASG